MISKCRHDRKKLKHCDKMMMAVKRYKNTDMMNVIISWCCQFVSVL